MARRSRRAGLLHRMLRRAVGVFICQHRRLVYPPQPTHDTCYDCGKKQLRDPATGWGAGRFSHDLDELLQERQARESRAASQQPRMSVLRRALKRLRRTDDRAILVFRNGQRRRIGNHAVTANSVLVFTKRGTVAVPRRELNIPATQAANQRRGIQFRLPS